VGTVTYLAVLGGCLVCALWLEPVLRVGVLRQWRRLALTLAPVAAAFLAWDVAAVAAGHWWFDAGQVIGVWLPGGLPLEEVLFFLVVPLCAILGFEAVRSVLARSGLTRPGLARSGPRSMPARRERATGSGGPADGREVAE
jgi:lycopene cyclase domain-containing protein